MAAPIDIVAYPFTSKVTYDEHDMPIYDRGVDAEILRNIQKQYFTNGVFADPTTCFKVSPAGGGLSIQVAPGACNIQGTTGYKITPTNVEFEPAGKNDYMAGVVLRWDDSLDVRAVQIATIRGTGSAPPVYTRTDTIHEMIISYVRIRTGANTIELTDIDDTRLNTDLCGLVRLPMTVSNTDPYFTQVEAYIAHLREVIDGVIDGSQYLLKATYDPNGAIAAANGILQAVYPVGSYYLSAAATNPASLFGFGIWEQVKGRMLMGVNEGDGDFNTAGKIGGSKIHTLTNANTPNHNHSVPALSGTAVSNGAHAHAVSGTAAIAGNHSHNLKILGGTAGPETGVLMWGSDGKGMGGIGTYQLFPSMNATEGYHTHPTSGTAASSGAHTHTVSTTASTTGNYGAGADVNHMNPFETAYIWKRTA